MSTTHRPLAPTSPEGWGQTPAPSAPVPMIHGGPGAALPSVERGALVVLRQFDVADEIDLARVQSLQASSRSAQLKPRAPIVFSNPPLTMALGQQAINLGGTAAEAELSARIFNFGAISVRLRVTLAPGTTWPQLSALVRAAQVDETLTRIAREAVQKLVAQIAPAVKLPRETNPFEDYVVVVVERFSPGPGGAPLLPRELPLDAVARLLLGEPDDAKLAGSEIEEATQHRSSYLEEDLCVAGWSTALVVEPTGDTDPVDVLELANAQLLELRVYDELLDHNLNTLYDEVGVRKARWVALLRNYGPVLRQAMTVMLEIAEFIERVENTLKIIGDVYLARLYANAVNALRIPAWERSVTRKQALIQQVYDVLKAEVDASRDQLLEGTIVALIVLEILLALGHVGR